MQIAVGLRFYKCDANWQANNGDGCQQYASKKWCKADGDHYGPEWNSLKLGTFERWADDLGRTAEICPQCGCTGGVVLRKYEQNLINVLCCITSHVYLEAT